MSIRDFKMEVIGCRLGLVTAEMRADPDVRGVFGLSRAQDFGVLEVECNHFVSLGNVSGRLKSVYLNLLLMLIILVGCVMPSGSIWFSECVTPF